jgi:hypothetical protein
MATLKNEKVNSYCDALNTELVNMKTRIDLLREDVKKTYGPDNELARTHERHLAELGDTIEWKLRILMKACPFEWKGGDKGIESAASVAQVEKTVGPDFSGGYIGG